MAVHPDGTRAYVTNFSSGTVSVIDTASNTEIATVPVGVNPIGVAVHPSGAWVYVANSGLDPVLPNHVISVISTATNTVVTKVDLAAVSEANVPFGIAIHPNGNKVYVTNQQGDSVSVIAVDTTTVPPTHAVVDTDPMQTGKNPIPVGDMPQGIAVHPDGSKVYVANGGGTLSVINANTNQVIDTIGLVGTDELYGVAVGPDGMRAYMTNTTVNGLRVMDTVTKALTAIPVGSGPRGVAVTPSGSHVYVANVNGDTVSVVNANTNTVVATVPVGHHPVALGLFIGPADRDGDGITDPVDVDPNGLVDRSTVFSDNFTDKHLGGTSSGTIVTRGGLKVTVWDAFNPAGFYARATGGAGTAEISACGVPVPVSLTDNNEVKLLCGSLTMDVIQGPVKIGLGAGTFASVPTGGAVKVTEVSAGVFRVENQGNTMVTIVDAQGAVLASVGPGQSFLTGNPNPVPSLGLWGLVAAAGLLFTLSYLAVSRRRSRSAQS